VAITLKKIRNSKSEIRNKARSGKFEYQISKSEPGRFILLLIFEFVSDLEFRISAFFEVWYSNFPLRALGFSPMHDEDDKLMLRLQGGDQSAFEKLVVRHQSPLIGFFHRQLRDWQLAEDLTQETLLRIHGTSWDYLPRGTFKAWMYRIARNLLIDTTRRRANDCLVRAVRSRPRDDHDRDEVIARLSGALPLPDELADRQDFAKLVDDLLRHIPEDQRVTFILHIYAGLSLPEVAAAMETNLPTTKSRLRLAREKLREKLAGRGIVDPSIAG
jgi:RNA polymerase sigma-70 factor (ECF subfamily)